MAGGGLGFTLSDMLHTHWLVAAVQMSSPFGSGFSLRDVAGSIGISIGPPVELGRLRARHSDMRWRADRYVRSIVLIYPRASDRTFVSAGATFPFSRARRFEVNASTARLAFDECPGSSALSWKPPPIPTLGGAAAAFVSDTSFAGATSMVSGERYRLEVAPVFGSLQYFHVTADYRRASCLCRLSPLPRVHFTSAVMAVVRKMPGCRRCTGISVARPRIRYRMARERLRGGAVGGMSRAERSRQPPRRWQPRAPAAAPSPARTEAFDVRPIPAEVAAFVDGGVAWRGSPGLRRGPGAPAWSAGITLRTNLIGFGVGQLDIARPFSRPDAGWVVQFNLSPAF